MNYEGQRRRVIAGDEGFAAPRGLVVEKYSVRGIAEVLISSVFTVMVVGRGLAQAYGLRRVEDRGASDMRGAGGAEISMEEAW